MDELAIKIEGLKKQYRLGTIGGQTLSAELQSWWARVRGKEDPNLKIGEDQTRLGEKFWALKGIDLEIKKGEAVGIIGPNGAGKSTLLKILSRVTAPTEGTVKMKGRISSMLEVGTGFHPELTGRENIYMNGAILGMSKREVDEKIEEIIDFSECRQFIDTPVKRYSSGMYVKLAFAVAAHLDAEILIMDEVLAVGDLKFQKKCLGKMEDASGKQGKTILYVSHNMNTIRQLCTRCAVLRQGKIVFDGDVERAIGIYAEQEKGDLRGEYELAEAKRPSPDHGRVLRITKMEFDRDSAVYGTDERIRFRLQWKASRMFDQLSLNLSVYYEDGSIAGMTQSETFGNGKINEIICTEFSFDAGNLAEGIYYFELDVAEVNEYGAHFSYDHPRQKIYFELKKTCNFNQNVYDLTWQRRYWGNVHLNTIKVEPW
ncbi:MAG: ABC transporter ATP-binding protein [Eubacteriales bacterium]|nr:ABC transporter ATP-binding protein [Eubacteriales bacterium]